MDETRQSALAVVKPPGLHADCSRASCRFRQRGRRDSRDCICGGGNRPIDGAIVNIRSVTGGPFVSILTDWSGRFQARGPDPGMYEIAVEEPSYEPTRLTLQLPRGPSRPLELYLKASNPSPVRRTDYTVSVRELRIPMKARNTFEKGLQRLAKHDAVGT